MNYLIKADIYIFSFIILVFLLVYFVMNAPSKSPSKKIFIAIIVSLLINSALAAVASIPDGITDPWAVSLNKWSQSLLMMFSYLPVAAWLSYVDYRLFNNFDNTKKHALVYLAPFFLSVVMVTLNPLTGAMFTVNDNNVLTRQAGTIIVAIIMYLELLALLYISQRIKKRINTRLVKIVFLFMLFPIFTSVLELWLPDVRLLWPAFSFSTFMVFLVLEKDSMLKDALTKLNTRAALETRIKQKLRRHEPFSLIMIDLDGFKSINDTFGHKSGDDALMIVASILEDSVKRTDMVCRYGGDEFLILVESLRPNAASYIRDRIKSRVSAFNKKKVKPYIIAMSFGLKFYNKSNVNLKQLMTEVDSLMYADKQNNKKAMMANESVNT